MDTIEVLEKARELISAPERWTYGMLARNQRGLSVDPLSDEAVSWCLSGALGKYSPPDYPGWNVSHIWSEAFGAIEETCCALQDCRLVEFNDKANHCEILHVFDVTIERLKGQS
jgi:hypothetical protein